MLKYHLIFPHQNHHNDSLFIHFLNTGYHQTPYQLPISAFTIVKCLSNQISFPIDRNPNASLLVPLEGHIKVNGQLYIADKQSKFIEKVQEISIGSDEKQKLPLFVYLASSTQLKEKVKKIKFEQNCEISLSDKLVLVIRGEIECQNTKIKMRSWEDQNPLLYAKEAVQIRVEKGSELLIISLE